MDGLAVPTLSMSVGHIGNSGEVEKGSAGGGLANLSMAVIMGFFG